jgi:hypothetical protein
MEIERQLRRVGASLSVVIPADVVRAYRLNLATRSVGNSERTKSLFGSTGPQRPRPGKNSKQPNKKAPAIGQMTGAERLVLVKDPGGTGTSNDAWSI